MKSYTTDQIAHIKNDPRERITDEINGFIDDPDVMFDVHCHVFNFDTVPDKLLPFIAIDPRNRDVNKKFLFA